MKPQHIALSVLLLLLLSCKGPDTHDSAGSDSDTLSSVLAEENTYNYEIESSIRALAVENDSTCWFAGSKNIFGITKDYGKSWKTSTILYDSLELEFRAIAMTNEAVFVLSVATPALLFKINKTSLDYELVYKEEGDKVFYDSMDFWDNNHGIAIGDPTGSCMSIITTIDGGNTWTKLDCEDLPSAVDGEAAFAASNSNISLADNKVFVVTGGKEANVLIGEDYGTKWAKVSTPINQGGQMTGIFTSHFKDGETGIIAGGNWEEKESKSKAMAITQDGGLTWQLIEDNPGYISCVQYRPYSEELIACSTNGIFYSETSGQSWKKISEDGYYAFRFAANGHVLYFSKGDGIMSTTLPTLLENNKNNG